jgi:hypothetical protein
VSGPGCRRREAAAWERDFAVVATRVSFLSGREHDAPGAARRESGDGGSKQ